MVCWWERGPILLDVPHRRFFLPRIHLVGISLHSRNCWCVGTRFGAVRLGTSLKLSVGRLRLDASSVTFRRLRDFTVSLEYFFSRDFGHVIEYLLVSKYRLNVFWDLGKS